MTPLSPQALQEARKAAAARFYAIGMAHLPPGFTFKFRKSLTGCCWYKAKRLQGPKPVTRRALQIWLHECAHAHGVGRGEPRHREEMLVERWSFERMREAGVPVPKRSMITAKWHVARMINKAKRHGAKRIDTEAAFFAERFLRRVKRS